MTNARGVYAVPIAEYVTGMVLRVHQPAAWATDQAAHRWPPEPPTRLGGPRHDRGDRRLRLDRPRGRPPALGARDADPRGQAAARSVRHDTAFRVPGTGDPDGSIPERIVGVEALAEAAAEADVLVLTMPLTDASRGIIDGRGARRAAAVARG